MFNDRFLARLHQANLALCLVLLFVLGKLPPENFDIFSMEGGYAFQAAALVALVAMAWSSQTLVNLVSNEE